MLRRMYISDNGKPQEDDKAQPLNYQCFGSVIGWCFGIFLVEEALVKTQN